MNIKQVLDVVVFASMIAFIFIIASTALAIQPAIAPQATHSISIGAVVPTVHPRWRPIEAGFPDNLENYDDESALVRLFKKSPATITVAGWIYYLARDGFRRSCAAATVTVYDSDTWPDPDDYLGDTLVADDGYFEISDIPNNDIAGGRDIYIKVITRNNMWAVRGINPGSIFLDYTYEWHSSIISNVRDRMTVYIGGDTPERGWTLSGENIESMQVFQDIRATSSFAAAHGHHPFNADAEFWADKRFLTCYWPSPQLVQSLTGGTSIYLPYSYKIALDNIPYPFNLLVPLLDDNNIIFIVQGSSADTVYHEYGHYMMDAAYGEMWPETHNLWAQILGGHKFLVPNNPIKAWSEGWADFVSAATRDYVRIITGQSIPEIGRYKRYYIDRLFQTSTRDKWKSTEGCIAAGLYDLYDSVVYPIESGSDTLNIGFAEIWDIIWDNRLDTVDDFWNAWRARGYSIAECWTIFAFNGIRLDWPYPKPTPDVTVTWDAETLLAGGLGTYGTVDDPFVIREDWVIDPEFHLNITLSSGYGVTIQFALEDRENRGVDKSRIEFIVYGELQAIGTTFESVFKNPGAGSWGGIRLKPGSKYALLTCTITDADIGVECANDAPNQFIHHCTFDNNITGIACVQDAQPIIIYAKIRDNSYGIRILDDALPNIGNIRNYRSDDNGKNTFHNNIIYDIANYTSRFVYAQNNNWGTLDAYEIVSARILGQVIYFPYRTPHTSIPIHLPLQRYQGECAPAVFDICQDGQIIETVQTIIPYPEGQTVIDISAPAGVYDIYAKSYKFLRAVKTNVVIQSGMPTVEFAPLFGGDANNDNVVDVKDLSILSAFFEKSHTEYCSFLPDADSTVTAWHADFNGDGTVDFLGDLLMLGRNFNRQGVEEGGSRKAEVGRKKKKENMTARKAAD